VYLFIIQYLINHLCLWPKLAYNFTFSNIAVPLQLCNLFVLIKVALIKTSKAKLVVLLCVSLRRSELNTTQAEHNHMCN